MASQNEQDGYRRIAAAVVMLAIQDAYGTGKIKGRQKRTWQSIRDVRADARAFLHPDNPMLAFYCESIDLDPAAVSEAAKLRGRALASSPAFGEYRYAITE